MSNSHSISQSEVFVNPTYILIDERPSPFARAEQVKREFSTRLDALLTDYEREIAASLSDADFSHAYRLAEIDAYLARLSRVLRTHERQTSERAVAAELAERGQAWTEQAQGGV